MIGIRLVEHLAEWRNDAVRRASGTGFRTPSGRLNGTLRLVPTHSRPHAATCTGAAARERLSGTSLAARLHLTALPAAAHRAAKSAI